MAQLAKTIVYGIGRYFVAFVAATLLSVLYFYCSRGLQLWDFREPLAKTLLVTTGDAILLIVIYLGGRKLAPYPIGPVFAYTVSILACRAISSLLPSQVSTSGLFSYHDLVYYLSEAADYLLIILVVWLAHLQQRIKGSLASYEPTQT